MKREKRERGKNTHVCKAPYRSTLFVSNFPFQNLRQLIRSSSPLPTTTLRAILFGTNTQRTHVQIQTGKLTHFTPRENFLGEALSFSMRPAGPSSSSWVSRVDGEAARGKLFLFALCTTCSALGAEGVRSAGRVGGLRIKASAQS